MFQTFHGQMALLPCSLPSHSSQGRETMGTMDHFLHKKDRLPQAGMHHQSALGERSSKEGRWGCSHVFLLRLTICHLLGKSFKSSELRGFLLYSFLF